MFISKLDSDGNFVWALAMAAYSGNDIVVAADGSVYSTGTYSGTVDFDPGEDTYNLTSVGSHDAFISKMDESGNLIWARSMGGTDFDYSNGIAVANDGSVYTTGSFARTCDFDPGEGTFNLTSAGSGYRRFQDVFVSKLDATGNFVWARHWGGTGSEFSSSIALGPDGSVYTAGAFYGYTAGVSYSYRTDFDPGPGTFYINSHGSNADIFLSKLLPDHAPTDIALSTNHVAEDQPVGTVVGTFTSTDPDPGEAFTYTLVSGAGSDDNASFTIDTSGQLLTAAIFDREVKSSYSIRVRSTDYSGMWFEKVFTITVPPVLEIVSLEVSSVVLEGNSAELAIQFTGNDLLDEYTVQIDWGDGSFEDVTLAVGARELVTEHPYLDDDPSGTAADDYTVSVTVSDGLAEDEESAVVTVNNVAPLVDPIDGPTPGPGVVGQTLAFSAGFDDPGTLDTHEVEWDFGDGTVIPFQSTDVEGALAPTHVYAAAGTFTVTVTIRDDDLGSSSQTKDVTIGSVALQDDPLYPGDTMLVVSGSDEDDHIVFAPKGKTAGVKVILNGTPLGVFEPTSRIVAFGLGGNDHIHVAGSIDLPAWLYGGTGDDWLYGGRGNDLLFGGLGDDLLLGKQGRDLLVGGPGSDRLVGNGDDDILIAGYLELAETDETLRDLMGVWTSRQWDYATRLAMLDDILVADDTVKNDDDRDVLIGSSGQDWFFHELGRDVVVGRRR